MTEPLHAQDPRQVGTYRLLGRLGSGGMGEVFLGESPGQRKVAVKLLRSEHARDAEFRQRFAREVAAAKRVGGFHTAPVVDADPDADPPWLVTAYIPGPSLATAVRENGPLDPEAVRLLGAALAEGVAAIHACGLVHRDLKPANIILAGDGPRIIDFGVARTPGAPDLTSTGILVGTVSFMSPEQLRGERADARSDVFSLGGVLAYAATGRGPFDGPTMPAIMHRITSGEPDLDGVDGPLREVIAACLAKDPAQRPALAALTARLTGAVRETTYPPPVHDQHLFPPERIEAPATVTAAPVPAPARPARRRRVWAAVSAAVVAMAAVAGILGYQLVGGAGAKHPAPLAKQSAISPKQSAAPVPKQSAAVPNQTVTVPGQPVIVPGQPAPAPKQPATLPVRFLGDWKGTLRSYTGLKKEYPTFTMTGGRAGAVVGHGSFRAGCAVAFSLASVRSGKVTLAETVRNSSCASQYVPYVVLTMSGQSLQVKEYRVIGGTPVFTGRLSHPAAS